MAPHESVEYMDFELGVLLEAEPRCRAKGEHATADSMKYRIEGLARLRGLGHKCRIRRRVESNDLASKIRQRFVR